MCVYLAFAVRAFLTISAVRARIYTERRDPSRRAEGEDGRKREKETEIERERSKHLDYVHVHAKHLLQAHHSPSHTLRGNRFLSLVCVYRKNP